MSSSASMYLFLGAKAIAPFLLDLSLIPSLVALIQFLIQGMNNYCAFSSSFKAGGTLSG
jgi:hypothetical protein